jgi:outer membrane protein, adhesin transport system
MKSRFPILSLLIIFPSICSEAQVTYNLNDCIRIGLDKNFSILIARNNESISNNNYTLGNAGYLPSLDLSGSYNGVSNNTTSNMTDGSQEKSKIALNTTASAGLNLGWTIFSGFNVRTTYRKLGELKQIGALNTQLSVENLVADIVIGYNAYIQQVQMLKNLEYAVTLSKERLRIDEDRYLLGSSSKLQVLQSRVYLNADSSNLSKQFEVVRAAQVRLNELMAVEDMGLYFTSQDTSVDVNPYLLYEKLLEETMTGNTSLNIANRDKTISEYDYKIIASRSYPYLNFSTGYDYNLLNYSEGTYKNQTISGMNYGLTLGVTLFDGLNQRRSMHNSEIAIMNKDLQYHQIEQGIKADLITIYSGYSNNLRLIKLEEQNLQTAAENLNIALERYKLGSLSGIDLREVQKSYLDAKERLLLIQSQAKLAEVSLQLISGKIMDYYK